MKTVSQFLLVGTAVMLSLGASLGFPKMTQTLKDDATAVTHTIAIISDQATVGPKNVQADTRDSVQVDEENRERKENRKSDDKVHTQAEITEQEKVSVKNSKSGKIMPTLIPIVAVERSGNFEVTGSLTSK